ncbi:hypothetical protein NE237_006996 [Protea cynaroides]|uniref:Protein kinase domain-containing protein n=1 Tax=Protea cynaroides TaxID=273540 RepID=A0A9Q0KNE2_9MAGN|nr:hypothetical protein NE237_006996 [Protea cynaroides]
MYPHLFFPSDDHHHGHLVFLFIIAIFIFFPFSISAYDYIYSNCTPSVFNCGNIQNIKYPFTENGRESNCGYPGFELECSEKEATIVLASEQYRVLNIDAVNRTMTIVQMDMSEDTICTSGADIVNTTVNHIIFNYAPGYINLTLFFGCSYNSSTMIKGYPEQVSVGEVTCSGNENGVPFSVGYNKSQAEDLGKRGGCSRIVIVPVLETSVHDILNNPSTLGKVLVEGFMLQWVAVVDEDCSYCNNSGGICGYNTTLGHSTCFCTDQAYENTCPSAARRTLNWWELTIAIGVSILIVTTLGVILVYYLRRKSSSDGLMSFSKRSTRNNQNVEAVLRNYGSLAPKRYSYPDIKKMTNSFRDKVGQGGHGGVFKGKLPDGRLVAVKVLNESKGNGEEFINEVASISRTSHVNVVSLLGFCFEGSKRALIYELMSNGSLEKFIYKTCPHFGWEKLYQVAIGVAKGLEYLHRGCNTRILHFDIKPHNILLDDDFCPKISDFGLAKLCLTKNSIISMANARGTIGYIAPEVFSRYYGGVSHKSDVYSYGMMVLEMVGGRRNFDAGVEHTSENYFPDWIYNHIEQGEHLKLDMILREEEEEIVRKMVLVGLWCIQMDPANRPSISRVVDMLEGSLESLSVPPRPCVSSPARELADSFTSSITS